jgi:hypothetical protein
LDLTEQLLVGLVLGLQRAVATGVPSQLRRFVGNAQLLHSAFEEAHQFFRTASRVAEKCGNLCVKLHGFPLSSL